MGFPKRIVCLTEEPTELLYLLGEQERIVGISGFTVRPTQARIEKPKVSAFTSAKLQKIVALKPDLVIGFSDIQADIARDLIKCGLEVWISNHRSVQGILDYCLRLAAIVGAVEKGRELVAQLQRNIELAKARATQLQVRPKVYFEEWDEPRISAIQWVAELVRIAGGDDIFPQRAAASLARERIVADDQEIISADPHIIIGSWCGKKFRPDQVAARPGWENMTAVKNAALFEIKSPLILQPGPATILAGLPALQEIIFSTVSSPAKTSPRRLGR
jgi:iron complex transport system substrate-binding protein